MMIRLKSGNGPVMRSAQRSNFPGLSLTHEIVNIHVSDGSGTPVASFIPDLNQMIIDADV